MLKKFASQEEFATAAEPVTIDDVYATVGDDEDENLPEEHARALETVDNLQTANEAWQTIVASAVKQNRVTPELCAGIEAHFARMQQELGAAVDEECASVESVGGDVELFLSQAQSSLESFSGKLGKIKNAILDRMSKAWNSKADRARQTEGYKAIGALAAKVIQSIKDKHGNNLNDSVTLSTGRYTTAFTSQGKVVTDPVAAIDRHLLALMSMFKIMATEGTNTVVDMVNIAGRVAQLPEDVDVNGVIDVTYKIADMITMADMVPARVATGEYMLGNLCLKVPKEDKKPKDKEQLYEYIARRSKYGVPRWENAGPRAESGEITIKYKDIIETCKKIQADANMYANWFTKLGDSASKIFNKIEAIKETNIPLNNKYKYAYIKAILNAVAADTVGRMTPIQQMAYKNMSIIRGWLGLFSKA